MALNLQSWEGRKSLLAPIEIRGPHSKNVNRPPIAETNAGTLATTYSNEGDPNAYLNIAERIREVYHSHLQFDLYEDEWHFSRLLGCGSFGLVALYERQRQDEVLDEVVAKSETPSIAQAVHSNRIDLSREVWHMAQLNTKIRSDSRPRNGVVRVRGYKYLTGDTSTQGNGTINFLARGGNTQSPLYQEWRTFMEYCSYGNLTRVILTYKAWGYHLPEAFVWWTFRWLIEACAAMDMDHGGPFLIENFARTPTPWPASFMLCNDIKDDNCFLGAPRPTEAPGAPFDRYPAVRMGDFGLSRVTKYNDGNRRDQFPRGTEHYVPPERRRVNMGHRLNGTPTYPFYSAQRVPGELYMRTEGIPQNTQSHWIGPEANVWGVGIVMFILMTLVDIADVDATLTVKLQPGVNRDDPKRPQHLFEKEDFELSKKPDIVIPIPDGQGYSRRLIELVRECTRIEPLKRPSIDVISKKIHDGIVRERDRLIREFDGDAAAIYRATRVALTNQDWVEVPQGPFTLMKMPVPFQEGIERVNEIWDDFYRSVEAWCNPDDPILIPPGRCQRMGQDSQVPGAPEWFLGRDKVLYVRDDVADRYHNGPQLPYGGRARRQPVGEH